MNPALAGIAVGVVAGGVLAVSARDARISIVGLALAVVFAPLVAQPLPDALPLAGRVVAAVLAVYLLWIVAREGLDLRPLHLGWPVAAVVALAAGLAGASSGALATPSLTEVSAAGVPEARAAGFALAVLAVVPILEARDALRLGTGLILGVLAAALLEQAMGGPVAPATHLAIAGIIVAIAATSTALGSYALAVSERMDRPLRAGAHHVARRPAGELLTEMGTAGSLQALRGQLMNAVRLRSAQARPLTDAARRAARSGAPLAAAARAGAVRARDRTQRIGDTVGRVRVGARLGDRLNDVRQGLRRSREGVDEAQPLKPVDRTTGADPTAVADTPTPTHSTTAQPPSISARSAGARRSLPRNE